MTVSKRLLCATICASLSACTSYRGADEIGSQAYVRVNTGNVASSGPIAGVKPSISLGLTDMFRDDLVRAIQGRYSQAEVDQTRLLNSGFTLIQSNCNAYFNEMGRNQRNSRAARSLVAPVSTLISALVGLKLFSHDADFNNDFVAGFSAFSAAGSAALDTYDSHFLFGSDNIGVVHTMTMSALSASRDAILLNPPKDVVVTIARLQDNERLCTPAQILINARESIKASQFTASNKPTPAPVVPPPDDDNDDTTPDPSPGTSGSSVVNVQATGNK